MSLILVVDDMAVFREPIAASLRLAGYETICAEDGEEALEISRVRHPDLILLDVAMPKMDGLTFLKCLRSQSDGKSIKVILLTALTDKKYIMAAAAYGVKDYLLKSRFRLQGLLERIGKLLSPPTAAPLPGGQSVARVSAPEAAKPLAIPQLLTRDQTVHRLESVAGGRTIAGVVAQVVAIASSPEANLSELVRVIQADPVLAARILQLANSASIGGRRRVSNIEEATRSIGLRGIQSMAVSIGIFGTFPPDEGDGFNSMRCWQHSFAVAELMGTIAQESRPDQEGLNHLVGLCRELGEILLRQHFGPEFDQILRVEHERELPMHERYSPR